MIRIGIVGYGNLAKGVECAIAQNPDMELAAVFSRRNPEGISIKTPNVPVLHISECHNWKDKIDVMILCGGSATDLPTQTPEMASLFHVVDSFDTHARIPQHFDAVDAAAKASGKVAVISAGWDPGMFSLNRLYASAILPEGKDYTFWGKGVSQGHSDAIRRVPGVKNGKQYTIPVQAALDAFGRLDILVNNAGIIKRIPMTEMTAAEFRQVIDVDLNAPFIVSKAVLPSMIKQRSGKIINICSMMSEFGRETVSAYASAKGGLKMLTRNIASEYGQYNIQCNGIGPGYIATPQTAPLRETQEDGSKHPFDSFICARTPAGRWLNPDELGGPAVFLASDASNAVNGHILYVDGGILAYIGKQP